MNIDKALEYLEKHKPGYGYYYDDRYAVSMPPRCGKTAFQELNCSDEIVPGSRKRMKRIQELKQEKIRIGSTDFMEKYGEIIHEMHNLVREEIMLFDDLSEQQANLWIDANIDFNHVKKHTIDGQDYLSVDPIIGNKYK